jgi:hypothetical protein
MLFISSCLLLLSILLSSTFAAKLPKSPHNYELFDGHKVIRTWPLNNEQLESLRSFSRNTGLLVDFWIEPRQLNRPTVIRIAPDQYAPTLAYLKQHRLLFEIQIDNLRPFIEADMKEMSERVAFNVGDHPSRITTNQYHNLDDINAYLDSLIANYTNLVTGFTVGNSHNGLPIRGVKIGMPGGNNRPAVFIDGCLHAREWLSCATMIYILNELTTKQDQYANYLNNLDIYILPVANVDGYAYTWTFNRLWRKTRSGPYNGNCYGVDPNRNWAYQWGVSGASLSPCDETYEGPAPFSEVETKSLADYICSRNDTIKSYMNIHTYSEDWMYSFGDVQGHYPDDVNTLRAISAQAVAAIQSVNGIRFAYGSIIDVIYPASGSSIDHTKAVCNVVYSYTMELRPGGNAINGFQLPASQIIAGASEAWAGIQVVWTRVVSDASMTGK